MALIKLGSNISEVSGSVNGHTFQKSQGGVQMRNKPINKRQPSQSQSFIRSIHLTLLYAWSNLSAAEQKIWNDFAGLKLFPGKFGDKVKLSGQALFLKYQFVYAYNHLPLITDPFNYNPEPLGPELITNGSFNGSAPWFFLAPFVYELGYASKNANGAAYFGQVITASNDAYFQLAFDVIPISGIPVILFNKQMGSRFFIAPLNVYADYQYGRFFVNGYGNGLTNQLVFQASSLSGVFKVSNISLREILS